MTASFTDDGKPLPYNPVYKWEVTSAPAGVTYQLVDADQKTATLKCKLPDGADENTWSGQFVLKFTVWDGDPDRFDDALSDSATLNATVRSVPSLRDRILSFATVSYRFVVGDAIPTLPAQVMASFSKSGQRMVNVTWNTINPGDLTGTGTVVIQGTYTGTEGVAQAPTATIYVRAQSSEIVATSVEALTIRVSAGGTPLLPDKAVVSFNDGTTDSHLVDIVWSIPETYLISPNTYELDMALQTAAGFVTLSNAKQHVTLIVEPGETKYTISSLTPVALGQVKLGNTPVIPTTVTANR